jgi:membrane protein DedA with SNARE-associated domain
VSNWIATAVSGSWWQYAALFLAVAASWAGVPFIGAAATGAAGIAASQGNLVLAWVIVVTIAAGEIGGLIGYGIGDRWGRQLLQRPGKHQEGRVKLVEKGEAAYARWGRLAVFVTPSIVSGTAKMQFGQFALWNFIDSLCFAISVALSAYGVGRVATGHASALDIAELVIGLATGAVLLFVLTRLHRRRKQRREAATGATGAQGPGTGVTGTEAP